MTWFGSPIPEEFFVDGRSVGSRLGLLDEARRHGFEKRGGINDVSNARRFLREHGHEVRVTFTYPSLRATNARARKEEPMVRAKFVCDSKTEFRHTPGKATIVLEPVTGGSDENKGFWEHTPGGRLELCTVNKDAADQFVVGREYYVDFTPATN
jgi:hypothetical protein